MKHIHAEAIKQWADGAEIEFWNIDKNAWQSCSTPTWYENWLYRVKPEKKPDIVKTVSVVSSHIWPGISVEVYEKKNVSFTFDGETLKLKGVSFLGEV